MIYQDNPFDVRSAAVEGDAPKTRRTTPLLATCGFVVLSVAWATALVGCGSSSENDAETADQPPAPQKPGTINDKIVGKWIVPGPGKSYMDLDKDGTFVDVTDQDQNMGRIGVHHVNSKVTGTWTERDGQVIVAMKGGQMLFPWKLSADGQKLTMNSGKVAHVYTKAK